MKIIGTVHKFNTGRRYAADGQEIVWAVIELEAEDRNHRKYGTPEVVAFNDRARGISAIIPLHVGNLDLITDAWVLRAYDDFHYTGYDFDVNEFLRTEAEKGSL